MCKKERYEIGACDMTPFGIQVVGEVRLTKA